MSTRCPRYEAFDASAVSYSMDTYMNAVSPATSLLCQLVLCFCTSLCSPLYLPTMPICSLFLYLSLFPSLPPYFTNAFSFSLPLSVPLSTTLLCQCILCFSTSLFLSLPPFYSYAFSVFCCCCCFCYISLFPLYYRTMPMHSLFLYLSLFLLYHPTMPMQSVSLPLCLFPSLPPYYASAFSVSLPLSVPLCTTLLCQCILCSSASFCVPFYQHCFSTFLSSLSTTLLYQCILCSSTSLCSPLYHPSMSVYSLCHDIIQCAHCYPLRQSLPLCCDVARYVLTTSPFCQWALSFGVMFNMCTLHFTSMCQCILSILTHV